MSNKCEMEQPSWLIANLNHNRSNIIIKIKINIKLNIYIFRNYEYDQNMRLLFYKKNADIQFRDLCTGDYFETRGKYKFIQSKIEESQRGALVINTKLNYNFFVFASIMTSH